MPREFIEDFDARLIGTEDFPREQKETDGGIEIMRLLNDKAFQERLVRFVEGIIRRIGVEERNDKIAEEAVQNAMVSILSSLERGSLKEGVLSPEAYIKISVRNSLFTILRKWQLDAKNGVTYLSEGFDGMSVEDILDSEPGFPVEEGVSLDVKMDSRSIQDYFQNEVLSSTHMRNLERNKQIFELRVQEGLDFTEIARIVFPTEYNYEDSKQREKAGDLVRQSYKRMLAEIRKNFSDRK